MPLGALYDGAGTNFSVFAGGADAVDLCLYADDGSEEWVALAEVDGGCHHAYIPGVGQGQRYAYRVHGPWDPAAGYRYNAKKLLLDPYATAIEGSVRWDEAVFTYRFSAPDASSNDADSAPFMPRSIVTSPYFDWGTDHPPRRPWDETIVYELHVKGFTMRNPRVPEELRGTYAGIAHPASVEYLTDLGVTAVELLPVHQFVHDAHLLERGLRNYWGYNSIGFLAPHNEYSSSGERGQQVQEFKAMVKTLHEAGIEVILDVVYNHTAEGNHLGPTLSFKGFDNAAYYRLVDGDRAHYYDTTGTGNSLNMRHPNVLQLIMDSLRYWAGEMHVDGFRFDLAATLARQFHEVDRLSAFFDVVQQDPVINRVKLIAEPWDIGDGGYQVGNFPSLWSEWNGKYRDTVRDYWRGEDATLGELAYRFTGSPDLYESDGRRPFASINFISAHDGFTLADLTAFNDKHNDANGEDNRDGESFNRSWNCGVEGPTDDAGVLELRARQRRNLLTTLLLSQGIPMLLGGDEIGRTQCGNNNGYCQDNELSWLDWEGPDVELRLFATRLIALRREHPVFRRRRYFQGRPVHGKGVADLAWFRPDGREMGDEDWEAGFSKSVAVFLNGDTIATPGRHGEPVADDSFLVVFNAHHEDLRVTLPGRPVARRWITTLSTQDPLDGGDRFEAGAKITVGARSVHVLRRVGNGT
jgi:glycogen operon protein